MVKEGPPPGHVEEETNEYKVPVPNSRPGRFAEVVTFTDERDLTGEEARAIAEERVVALKQVQRALEKTNDLAKRTALEHRLEEIRRSIGWDDIDFLLEEKKKEIIETEKSGDREKAEALRKEFALLKNEKLDTEAAPENEPEDFNALAYGVPSPKVSLEKKKEILSEIEMKEAGLSTGVRNLIFKMEEEAGKKAPDNLELPKLAVSESEALERKRKEREAEEERRAKAQKTDPEADRKNRETLLQAQELAARSDEAEARGELEEQLQAAEDARAQVSLPEGEEAYFDKEENPVALSTGGMAGLHKEYPNTQQPPRPPRFSEKELEDMERRRTTRVNVELARQKNQKKMRDALTLHKIKKVAEGGEDTIPPSAARETVEEGRTSKETSPEEREVALTTERAELEERGLIKSNRKLRTEAIRRNEEQGRVPESELVQLSKDRYPDAQSVTGEPLDPATVKALKEMEALGYDAGVRKEPTLGEGAATIPPVQEKKKGKIGKWIEGAGAFFRGAKEQEPKQEKVLEERFLESELRKKALEARSQAIQEYAQKIGPEALRLYRQVGEKINAIPTRYKVAVGIGLAGGVFATGAAAPLIAATVGWRMLTGAATFVTLEKMLERDFKKKGIERSKMRQRLGTAGALILATLVGNLGGTAIGNLGSGISESVDDFLKESPSKEAHKPEAQEEVGAVKQKEIPQPVVVEGAKLPDYTVERGDNLYKIIKENFNGIAALEGGRQANAIENVLAEMKKDPAAYGISSGNLNNLNPNKDIINLEKIRDIIENHQVRGQGIIERAEGLAEGTVKNIEAWRPSVNTSTIELTPTEAEVRGAGEEIREKEPIDGDVSELYSSRPEGEYEGLKPKEKAPITVDLSSAETAPVSEENAYGNDRRPEGFKPEFKKLDPETYQTALRYFDDPENMSLNEETATYIKEARMVMHDKLTAEFGEKKLFGLFTTSGENSEVWQEWKDKTIETLMKAENPTPETQKLQNLIKVTARESGLTLLSQEKVEDFMKGSSLKIASEGKLISTPPSFAGTESTPPISTETASPGTIPAQSAASSGNLTEGTAVKIDKVPPNDYSNLYSEAFRFFDTPDAGIKTGMSRLDILPLEDARAIMEMRFSNEVGDLTVWEQWKNRSMADLFAEKNPTESTLKLRAFIEKAAQEADFPPIYDQQVENYVKATFHVLARITNATTA